MRILPKHGCFLCHMLSLLGRGKLPSKIDSLENVCLLELQMDEMVHVHSCGFLVKLLTVLLVQTVAYFYCDVS